MRFALRKPFMDAANLYLSQVSSLLRRQHFAVKSAYATVGRRPVPDNALLFENSDLNSSSLYCGHLGVVVRFAISLRVF